MRLSFESVDLLIKAGKRGQARQSIREISKRRLNREQRLAIAKLARRVREPVLAIRLLRPVVYPAGRRTMVTATSAEKAEYAANLISLGARSEALSLLQPIDGNTYPEKLLFEAFAHFANWGHSLSVPLLRSYVLHRSLNEYEHMIGKVNLASALIVTGAYAEVESLLSELSEKAKTNKNVAVLQRIYQLQAGFHIYRQEWEQALRVIASGRLLNAGQEDPLFEKWFNIAKIFNMEKTQARSLYLASRKKALTEKGWEIVRDYDHFASMRFADRGLFLHLYFGTPFAEYRTRLIKSFPSPVEIPPSYDWVLNGDGAKKVQVHVGSGRVGGSQSFLRRGLLHHRFLMALASDFYRPLRVGEIYSMMFPGEHFNPLNSPGRVHQAAKGLREWSGSQGLGLLVHQYKGQYFLGASKPITLTVENRDENEDVGLNKKWIRLAPLVQKEKFSTSEACKILNLTPRAARRFLSSAVHEGLLQRHGENRDSVYSLPRKKRA